MSIVSHLLAVRADLCGLWRLWFIRLIMSVFASGEVYDTCPRSLWGLWRLSSRPVRLMTPVLVSGGYVAPVLASVEAVTQADVSVCRMTGWRGLIRLVLKAIWSLAASASLFKAFQLFVQRSDGTHNIANNMLMISWELCAQYALELVHCTLEFGAVRTAFNKRPNLVPPDPTRPRLELGRLTSVSTAFQRQQCCFSLCS